MLGILSHPRTGRGEYLVVLSDIHSNLEALTAVSNDLNDLGGNLKDIVFLGDLVGYGPNPVECTDIFRMNNVRGIRGNHDAAVIGESNGLIKRFNLTSRMAVHWTQEQLEEKITDSVQLSVSPKVTARRKKLGLKQNESRNMTYLRGLHIINMFEAVPGLEDCMASHGSLVDHSGKFEPEMFHYIEKAEHGRLNEPATLRMADLNFAYMYANYKRKKVFLTGHYHTPSFYFQLPNGRAHRVFVDPDILKRNQLSFALDAQGNLHHQGTPRETNGRYTQFTLNFGHYQGRIIANPGSVGQSRDGITHASYMVYAPSMKRLIWRRVKYDVQTTSEKIRLTSQGDSLLQLSSSLADRLLKGV